MGYSRIEDAIESILSGSTPDQNPQSRIEELLLKNDVHESNSRIEALTQALIGDTAGEQSETFPQSRIEAILSEMLGFDVSLENPKSRIEKLLLEFLDKNRPRRIEVTTPPNKTLYTSGETIDFTGIVVTAYRRDNSVLGVVPYEELEFPVTIARTPG